LLNKKESNPSPIKKMSLIELQASIDAACNSNAVSRNLCAYIGRCLFYSTLDDSSLPSIDSKRIFSIATGSGPSCSTLRLQTSFDSAYFQAHRALEAKRHSLRRKVIDIASAISAATEPARTAAAKQFATTQLRGTDMPGRDAAGAPPSVLTGLSTVHRLLLDYCGAVCGADPAAAGVRPSSKAASSMGVMEFVASFQKELAAALESVLPKATLQLFAESPPNVMEEQMNEAALLVLGIRLYNWDSGKGGAGLEHVPQLASKEAKALLQEVDAVATSANTAAGNYVDVLSALYAGKVSASQTDATLWPLELVNRRQLATHMSGLAEDAGSHVQKAEVALNEFTSALASLKHVLSSGGRGAPISKEAVYPHFRAMAESWLAAANLRHAIAAVAEVVDALKGFIADSSVPCSLSSESVRRAKNAIAGNLVGQIPPILPPTDLTPVEVAALSNSGSQAAARVQLSPDEFTPLEFCGYCPVSLSTPASTSSSNTNELSMGILQHGDFTLGLANFNGKFYVCSSEAAMIAFLARPAFFLARIRSLCLQRIELIQVLQAFDKLSPADEADPLKRASFPAFAYASLTAIVEFNGDLQKSAGAIDSAALEAAAANNAASNSSSSQATEPIINTANVRIGKKGVVMADAGVETPVHFVERHIDPRYEFSEWALRRRAIKLANLRKCATHSAQTDASNFRRDNDTQIYLPRDASMQTTLSVSTNTERTVSYVTGVFGVPEPIVQAAKANIQAGKSALPSSKIKFSERTQPIATQVDNIIDECQEKPARVILVSSGGTQTTEEGV
jgi:hypothetical protein